MLRISTGKHLETFRKISRRQTFGETLRHSVTSQKTWIFNKTFLRTTKTSHEFTRTTRLTSKDFKGRKYEEETKKREEIKKNVRGYFVFRSAITNLPGWCVDTRMDQIQFPLLEQHRGWSKLRCNKPDTLAIQVHNENKLSRQHAVHSEGNNTHGGRSVMRNVCCAETKERTE
jgi:hypothetical protein